MAKPQIRVALWTRQKDRVAEVSASLNAFGCQVRPVESLEQLLNAVGTASVDVVVALPDATYSRPWQMLSWAQDFPPTILLCPCPDFDHCLEAMQKGAFACVPLPADPAQLEAAVRRAAGARLWPAASGK
jgi:DNA-binding NtrC family response regulator